MVERTAKSTGTFTSRLKSWRVLCFNLESLYFGCTLNTVAGNAALLEACSITNGGYEARTGKTLIPVTFSSKSAGATSSSMTQAILPAAFAGLNKVTVVPNRETTTAANGVMYSDDFAFSTIDK